MTALARTIVSVGGLLALVACTNYLEVPVETPLQPKLDVSGFQRVLIAGFVTGGSDEVDTNLGNSSAPEESAWEQFQVAGNRRRGPRVDGRRGGTGRCGPAES